jgi:hypothetical protein
MGVSAMANTTTRPIHLTFKSVEQVVVEPDDNDRFVTTSAEAARACQQAQATKEFQDEFKKFLSYIHGWCIEQAKAIESGYVDIGDGGLRVNICMKSDDFDFEFDDKITELDIKLAQEFPSCIAEVTQIPKQVCGKLELDAEYSLQVYGEAGRTPEAG